MEKPKNLWLQMNYGRINSLLYKMQEERFKSSYQGQLDLGLVILLYNGMINEIEKLDKDNEDLKKQLTELKSKANESIV
jgi:sensor histidine kinase YesM